MSKLCEFIDFVNSQADFHERQSDRFKDDARRSEMHHNTASKFRALAAAINENEELLGSMVPLPSKEMASIALSWNEVQDLPEELIAELSISESDKYDFGVISIIDECGGMASLDRILVELFKQTGEISKRSNLNARLYRMSQKGLVFSVPGKKGVYSTYPINEDVDD